MSTTVNWMEHTCSDSQLCVTAFIPDTNYADGLFDGIYVKFITEMARIMRVLAPLPKLGAL